MLHLRCHCSTTITWEGQGYSQGLRHPGLLLYAISVSCILQCSETSGMKTVRATSLLSDEGQGYSQGLRHPGLLLYAISVSCILQCSETSGMKTVRATSLLSDDRCICNFLPFPRYSWHSARMPQKPEAWLECCNSITELLSYFSTQQRDSYQICILRKYVKNYSTPMKI